MLEDLELERASSSMNDDVDCDCSNEADQSRARDQMAVYLLRYISSLMFSSLLASLLWLRSAVHTRIDGIDDERIS